MILAQRLVPQVAAPPSTRTRTVYDDDSRISDPAEIVEVDRSGSRSKRHDGVWWCGGVNSPRARSFAEPHVKGRENEREKLCIFLCSFFLSLASLYIGAQGEGIALARKYGTKGGRGGRPAPMARPMVGPNRPAHKP